MKRLLIFAVCFAFLFGPILSACEKVSTYQNAGALYEGWLERDGIPDYVSDIWSTDGSFENLTIAVVDDDSGRAGESEILSLIDDDSTVTIVYQEKPVSKLKEIQNELHPLFYKAELGLRGTRIDEIDNVVDVDIHVDYKENPETQEVVSQLRKLYGDMIRVSFVDYENVLTDLTETEPTAPVLSVLKPRELMMNGVVWIAVFVVLAVLLIARKRVVLLQNGGSLMRTGSNVLSGMEIESEIRALDVPTSADLDRRVMDFVHSQKQ